MIRSPSDRRDTSPLRATDVTPSAAVCRPTCSISACVRESNTKLHPARAKACAMASPIPRPAPVITAVSRSSVIALLLLHYVPQTGRGCRSRYTGTRRGAPRVRRASLALHLHTLLAYFGVAESVLASGTLAGRSGSPWVRQPPRLAGHRR